MLKPNERIFCEWANGSYLNTLEGSKSFVNDLASLVRQYGTPIRVEIRNELNERSRPHEADAWIVKSWMFKNVRQIESGRIGKVEETRFDEKGALHCRTDDMIWCPASKLDIL